MILYFAGCEDKIWARAVRDGGGVNILLSYFWMRDTYNDQVIEEIFDLIRPWKKRLFMDSGAFTAWTKDIKIDKDQYIEFLQRHSDIIDLYANIDVLGDAKATAANQRYLEKRGMNPLPTFHVGSDMTVLKRMVDKYDYIALGNMVGNLKKRTFMRQWLDACFSIIKDKALVHGFGLTSNEPLKRYPFYSVDSTSWLSTSKHGQCYHFNGQSITGYDIHMNKRGVNAFTMKYLDDKMFGIEGGEKRYTIRMIEGIGEWLKFERFITELWEKKGIRFSS